MMSHDHVPILVFVNDEVWPKLELDSRSMSSACTVFVDPESSVIDQVHYTTEQLFHPRQLIFDQKDVARPFQLHP
ncbi:hypothetical protein JHK84_044871 [Glycine max]|nr:hypothetical protein JHK84_044871 [Glycine max]KAH1205393.1 hypothetical protein GmHk_16G046107 [Glycine max]